MVRVSASALLLLVLATAAEAETRAGLMLRPLDEDAELEVEVDRYLESRTDAGFGSDLQLFATRGRVRLAPRLGRRSPLLGWDALYLDNDTADPRLPGTLTESSVAAGFGFAAGEWNLGVTAGFGFAGDEPFHGRGWYGLGSVTGTRRYERDILQLGLDFDGNRPIFPDVPLPVVVWTRTWNTKLRTSLGFPFVGVTWDPAPWVTLDFRGIPGVFQTGGVTFHAGARWDVFVRYRGANYRFFVDSFPNGNRRLFYTEDRAEVGVAATVGERWEIAFAAGWAFDREYETGWDVRDTDPLATLDDGVVLGVTVTLTF